MTCVWSHLASPLFALNLVPHFKPGTVWSPYVFPRPFCGAFFFPFSRVCLLSTSSGSSTILYAQPRGALGDVVEGCELASTSFLFLFRLVLYYYMLNYFIDWFLYFQEIVGGLRFFNFFVSYVSSAILCYLFLRGLLVYFLFFACYKFRFMRVPSKNVSFILVREVV